MRTLNIKDICKFVSLFYLNVLLEKVRSKRCVWYKHSMPSHTCKKISCFSKKTLCQ